MCRKKFIKFPFLDLHNSLRTISEFAQRRLSGRNNQLCSGQLKSRFKVVPFFLLYYNTNFLWLIPHCTKACLACGIVNIANHSLNNSNHMTTISNHMATISFLSVANSKELLTSRSCTTTISVSCCYKRKKQLLYKHYIVFVTLSTYSHRNINISNF